MNLVQFAGNSNGLHLVETLATRVTIPGHGVIYLMLESDRDTRLCQFGCFYETLVFGLDRKHFSRLLMAQDQECRFEILLDMPRERAFSLFVDKPELWWSSPFDAVGEGKVEAGIEPCVGGNCYEIDGEGRRRQWGTVLSIEAPLYIRLAWQVSLEGAEVADPSAASRVMVNFRQAGEATRVEIVHTEFLRHGEDGAEYQNNMRKAEGWPRIIKNLEKAAKAVSRR
ncbi:SRPBCC family protein [Roseibium sp.]|uniref:SRPBCC family protein n=1 Tax=Roseibium sp. TaxID=1936156 RepID=UPI002635D423|nr:SRPBCC family protein [Roseibium sp.]